MLKKFNSFINMSIITAILFLLLGGVIVIFPSTSLKIISYFLALILIIIGISLILKSTSSFVFSDFITSGILSLLLGIILLIYPKMLNIIIPIITGVWFIVSSIFKIRLSLVLKKYGVSSWLWAIILSILTIICGVLLIINPNIGALMFTTILGMLFIVYSISDIIDLIIFKKNANTIAKIFK